MPTLSTSPCIWYGLVLGVPLAGAVALSQAAETRFDPLQALQTYHVVWNSPSENSDGTMPIGNGEIGLNVWWERNGDLQFLIARTDAWDELGRLVKLGKVRIALDPNPVRDGQPFRQTLNLRDGAIDVEAGQGAEQVRVRLWVDANHPVIHATVASGTPVAVTASLELWRNQRRQVDYAAAGYFGEPPFGAPGPAFVGPDVVVSPRDWPGSPAEAPVAWYHHNGATDWYEVSARLQGLEGFDGQDPLENRTFGGAMVAAGAQRDGDRVLRTPPATTHRLDILTLTRQPCTPEEWLKELVALRRETEAVPFETRQAAHTAWWQAFWQRSWVFVSANAAAPKAQPFIGRNAHPVRLGVDQAGGNRYAGELGRVSLLAQALDADEVSRLAQTAPDGALPGAVPALFSAVGPASGLEALRDLDPGQPLTIELWAKPAPLPPGGARLVDKITPGADDGVLLDTHPGNSLRLITALRTLQVPGALPPDQWHHVAAVVDGPHGVLQLFVDGKRVAREMVDVSEPTTAVTRGYVLQRWVTACAGRGALPIKFNGSLFTVPYAAGWDGDPDFRRWGSGYWWQNTRLPYLSACASGDTDLLPSLFRMYSGQTLAMARYRTQHHLGHAGAFLNECSYFWGHAFNDIYGWKRSPDTPAGINEAGWHRWEFTAGYELLFMMLDYYEHALDDAFARTTMVPFARDILTFYDRHYPTDAAGKIVIQPGQALETWWTVTNPMPDIAGLTAVTSRLLALPEGLAPAEDRGLWQRLRDKLPELPVCEVDGVRQLAPGASFSDKRNVENPELYAVFPFRLIGVGKPDAELGLEALRRRADRGTAGWRQDDLFMAYLGLAEEARETLVQRARTRHTESRFPAFWGPNYDWVPDQDHGGVLMRTVQVMLLQSDGRRIVLLPAWPQDWTAEFRLQAPYRTVITGRVEGGRLVSLDVQPPERRSDVVLTPAP